MQHDWTKPAAKAIPKEGFFEEEQGQPINLSGPHPFTAEGNREFNSFLWMPPSGTRGGDILLADSTIFTTLFGGTESLKHFWWTMAKLRRG